MSELESLREQVQALTARVAFFEQHHTPQTPPDLGPRPNGPLTARLDAAYDRNKARLQRGLASMLVERYGNLAQGDNFANSSITDLAQLPRMIAEELTRVTPTRADIEETTRMGDQFGMDNAHKLTRLKVELAAFVRHADDLLSTTTLPEVPEELAKKAGLPRLGHVGGSASSVSVAGGFSR